MSLKSKLSKLPISLLFLIVACEGPIGPDGYNSLIKVTNESPGVNCPNGGIRVDTGLDTDRSGVLEDEEITTTKYTCNALNSLIAIKSEPPGTNCKNGGTKISHGLDASSDKILDQTEIISNFFICNDAKVYIALLSQSGTQPPVSSILENSLEINITWTREAAGKYIGTLDKPIDITKSTIIYSVPIGNDHTAVRGQIMNATQIRLEFQWGINVFNDNFQNVTLELMQYE